MALWRRRPPAEQCIAHADQGSQYRACARDGLRAAGLLGSIGSIGDAYDNARLRASSIRSSSSCSTSRAGELDTTWPSPSSDGSAWYNRPVGIPRSVLSPIDFELRWPPHLQHDHDIQRVRWTGEGQFVRGAKLGDGHESERPSPPLHAVGRVFARRSTPVAVTLMAVRGPAPRPVPVPLRHPIRRAASVLVRSAKVTPA